MSTFQPCARRFPFGTVATVLVGYGILVRPWLLKSGATPDEVIRTYPGDELIPEADASSTMATTLPAPPERVWPWLQQMGNGRGGWYSFDRLDNGGRPSAERIVPEWQNLAEGDRLNVVPSGDAWFMVAVLIPERTLVLRSMVEWPSGHSIEPSHPLPRAYVDAIWAFHLEPTPDGQTRLVIRTRSHSRPRILTRPMDVLYWEPAHLIMQKRQFHNLRQRVRVE